MRDRENILERIRKLLEHSVENGATETEAVAFALKAQKLIAEYDVEDWELGEKTEKVIHHTCSNPSYRTRRGDLAITVAKNFRCLSTTQTSHSKGGTRMEKLLHEKLMEMVQCSSCESERSVLKYEINDEYGNRKCAWCSEAALKAMACDLERDYISREQHETEIMAIVEAQGCDGYSHGYPYHIMKEYAEEHGMPMKEGETISDWLGRWFIKCPCDPEGKPWSIGDDAEQGTVMGLSLYESGWTASVSNGITKPFVCIDDLKRPTPKVVDVDGVEIKRGDEVWRINSKLAAESGSLIVEGVCDKGVYTDLRVDGKAIFFDPLQLTHDQPVFDADDVRICKGDTVWYLLFNTILGGKRLEVVQLKSAEEVLDTFPHIIVKDDDGAFYTLFPYNLTHREPDSQKLIDADAELNATAYCKKYDLTPHEASAGKSTKYKHLFKRQRALTERGA